MDETLIRLDARLGALELLVRNLYAQRFAGQANPAAAAEKAARQVQTAARAIVVDGSDPATNDLLAAEAEEFLVAMFHEIVEIVRQADSRAPVAEIDPPPPDRNPESPEWRPFPDTWTKLRRTG